MMGTMKAKADLALVLNSSFGIRSGNLKCPKGCKLVTSENGVEKVRYPFRRNTGSVAFLAEERPTEAAQVTK